MIEVVVPIRIWSANTMRTKHWRENARVANVHKDAVLWTLQGQRLPRPPLPVAVTLTRIGAKKMDDDNLAAGFKATRDAVAKWLAVDDGDAKVRWIYEQEIGKAKEFAAKIVMRELEAA